MSTSNVTELMEHSTYQFCGFTALLCHYVFKQCPNIDSNIWLLDLRMNDLYFCISPQKPENILIKLENDFYVFYKTEKRFHFLFGAGVRPVSILCYRGHLFWTDVLGLCLEPA